MTIKDRLEEWQKQVNNCRIHIKELASATEAVTHSMTAFEYQSKLMPEMYSQPGQKQMGWEHAVMDINWSEDNLTRLEDDMVVHTPPGIHEAYAELIKLASDKRFDENVMDPAYSKILVFLFNEAPKQIAEACVPKDDNPYPKARPLAPLTKKELADKIADMKLRIDLERDPNRRLLYRSALQSYELRLKEVSEDNPGAVRVCPLCRAKLESYPGAPLRVVAREHYAILHMRRTTPEEEKTWRAFYDSLPKERG